MRWCSLFLVASLALGACAHVGTAASPKADAKNACTTIAGCTLSCDRGDLPSCSALASSLFALAGIAGNVEKADALWRRLCDGGDPDACKSLAGATALGNGVPLDKAKAKALYARAAKLWGAGCEAKKADDCYSLAVLYRDGLGVPRDRTRMLALMESACAFDAMECRFVGFALRSGDPRRLEEELLRFERACGGGDSIACDEVAKLSKDPEAARRAGERARELDRKAVEQDVAECTADGLAGWCAAAAVAYREGTGVAKDDARADDFLARAVARYERACARQGSPSGDLQASAPVRAVGPGAHRRSWKLERRCARGLRRSQDTPVAPPSRRWCRSVPVRVSRGTARRRRHRPAAARTPPPGAAASAQGQSAARWHRCPAARGPVARVRLLA